MRQTLDRTVGSRDGAPGAAGTHRRGWVRALHCVPLLLLGVLMTACSGGSSGAADSGGAKPTGSADRALAYAKCMRENGVTKFPDPKGDGSGVIGKDSGIDPESPTFKKAMEACKDLTPQGAGPAGGKPIDAAKGRAWAECVRDNGVKDFPDPDSDTGRVDMTGVGTGGEDPTLDKALETCADKKPAGTSMTGNGGGR
ncbi:hypothetical protein OG912_22565 [Streptomyces sp. NBC_00464]|uniref:hypothetical protein n=1 Tax=Streptomyces sp. NBC_00464 TaxID=2975751 RepID=UPI002E1806D6